MPLLIDIPDTEGWDSANEEFITIRGEKAIFEHSLLSISKWESKWHKPFFYKQNKTAEETNDYIRCMLISKHNQDIVPRLTKENVDAITKYIENTMTATTFSEEKGGKSTSSSYITNELIYYKMCMYNIPFDCEKWHINRLLTLIKIFDMKNGKQKKQSLNEIYTSNRERNLARRAMMNSKG